MQKKGSLSITLTSLNVCQIILPSGETIEITLSKLRAKNAAIVNIRSEVQNRIIRLEKNKENANAK